MSGDSRRQRIPKTQQGAVLLMLLVAVTLLGLLAGIAGASWRTIVQRAQEADLLWKGTQIRRAIGGYYEMAQPQGGGPKAFPTALEDLLLDPRTLEPRRYLRRLYPDPLTGQEWEYIPAPGGGIMGVRSRSSKKPFKQTGFAEENKAFNGQPSYRGWQFVYQPKAQTQQHSSKAGGTAGPAVNSPAK